jgi:hypothetical protein
MAEGDEKEKLVRIHIDRIQRESPRETTHDALYLLGEVPAGSELFLEVEGDKEDEPVARGNTAITVKEDQHFYSAKVFQIIMNGVAEPWAHDTMDYDQAVKLAFPDGPTGGDIKYSVTWTKPDGQEGSLRPSGKAIGVVNEMIFDVRNTDKS